MKGYTRVAELNTGGYDWSAVGVWRQKDTGRLYWATDSGCSCFAPWDNLDEASLSPLDTPEDWARLERATFDLYEATREEKQDFLDRARVGNW